MTRMAAVLKAMKTAYNRNVRGNKRVWISKQPLLPLMVGAWLLLSHNGLAAKTINQTVNITGTVLIPPCSVNNNATLDVDFGDVSIVDPTNNQYLQTRQVSIACTYYQGTPHVKLTGTLFPGTSSVISTSTTDLGIEFYQGAGTDTIMMVGGGANNNGYPITAGLTGANSGSGTFTFSMRPWNNGPLTQAGTFTAAATMSMIYD